MIKSNWPIKNLIVIGLNFYANSSNNHLIWPWICIFSSILGHNGVQLGLNFLQKLQLDFPVCFLHVASLYFIFLIFILKKKKNFWGITQNWVMTVALLFTMFTIESLVRDFR